jgi:hypothetical protein
MAMIFNVRAARNNNRLVAKDAGAFHFLKRITAAHCRRGCVTRHHSALQLTVAAAGRLVTRGKRIPVPPVNEFLIKG